MTLNPVIESNSVWVLFNILGLEQDWGTKFSMSISNEYLIDVTSGMLAALTVSGSFRDNQVGLYIYSSPLRLGLILKRGALLDVMLFRECLEVIPKSLFLKK